VSAFSRNGCPDSPDCTVEFLSGEEAASYGQYVGVPSQAELAKVFLFDDDDRALIERRRTGRLT